MTRDDELLDVAEARGRLIHYFAPLAAELIPLADSVGRILAENIFASVSLPPFPNSAMDGFAVISADLLAAGIESPVILEVIEDIPAGTTRSAGWTVGSRRRIMTGAALPDGADAVVRVEDTDVHDRDAGAKAPERVADPLFCCRPARTCAPPDRMWCKANWSWKPGAASDRRMQDF